MAEKGTYKVKITVGDATVEIEGAEQGVVSLVSTLSKILERRPEQPQPEEVRHVSITKAARQIVDIRTFFEQKRPTSDVEATAVVAFYYRHVAPIDERRDTISSSILEKAFQLAKWKLPKRPILTLGNTRNAGYLEPGPDSGTYRLNAVGYNLVEHTLGAEEREEPVPHKKKRKSTKRSKKAKKR